MTGADDPAEVAGDDLTRPTLPDGDRIPTHLYAVASDEVVAALDTITDPADRFWACENAAREADQRGRLAHVRRDAVRALRGTGRPPLRTWAEVGDLIGTTGTRAQQIAALEGDRSAPRGPRTRDD